MAEEFYPGSLKSGSSIGATSVVAEGVYFKGNILGDKNLAVEGRFEGRVDLRTADVIVRETGTVKANILAEVVTVEGKVIGDVTGMKQVIVSKTGSVVGNIASPSVSLEEGCNFKGTVDMDEKAIAQVIATLKAVEKAVAEEDAPELEPEMNESLAVSLLKKAAND